MRVLITGANKGIGYQAALQLASEGHHVILAARNPKLGAEAIARIREAVPTAVLDFVTLDVSDQRSIETAAAQIAKSFADGIDVLVNNAGIIYQATETEGLAKEAEMTNGTNYFGVLNTTLAFLPLIRDHGRVVNVSSRLGLSGHIPDQKLRKKFQDPALTVEGVSALVNEFITAVKAKRDAADGWPSVSAHPKVPINVAYYVSKIALNALTQVQARDPEFVRRHISVNSCCPGWCRTDMGGAAAERTDVEGADVVAWLSASDDTKNFNGKFYAERRELDYEHGPLAWP